MPNPAQPGYAAQPVQVSPTYFQGAQIDPALMAALTNPQNSINQLNSAYGPQNQRAVNNLNNTLGAYGITGGQAVQQYQNLQNNIAQGEAPSLANLIAQSMGLGLQGAEANAGFTQQAGLSNQNAANQASLTNAGAINSTNAANVGAFNNANSELFNAIMQAYLQKMGILGGLNANALGATGGIAQQTAGNFGVNTGSPFTGLAGALGNIFGNAAQSQPSPQPNPGEPVYDPGQPGASPGVPSWMTG